MKSILIILFSILIVQIQGQTLVVGSWNIKDFGKSRDDEEIMMIAELLRDFDIVAIQEVVAIDPGGAQAVARLIDELDRKGSDWDYSISDPTKSSSNYVSERYAFIWKKHKVKLISKPRLLSELASLVEREPYYASFKFKDTKIDLTNYHACTHKSDFPERDEIKAISFWLVNNCKDNIIWCGDMNLEIDDEAFKLIKSYGFSNLLNGEPTSLKKSCINGNYLSRSEDNILYYLPYLNLTSSEVIDFVKSGSCDEVLWKRNAYSDHLPIKMVIE